MATNNELLLNGVAQHAVVDRQTLLMTQPWYLALRLIAESAAGGGEPSFGVIAVRDEEDIKATQQFDTLTVVAGANITLETNALGKSLTISAPASAPADPDTAVQFNDGGVFGGNAAFTFDKQTQSVSIGSGNDFGVSGLGNLLIGTGHQVA